MGIVVASVIQPLSTQYKLGLQLNALTLALESSREDERSKRLETIDQVHRAYYAIVEAQSQLDSLKASLPLYTESSRLAVENRKTETILESDLQRADAQLLRIQSSISDATDQFAAAAEKLNDLMGREIHTRFRVAAIKVVLEELETPEELEKRALQNRPDLKKARLQVRQAEYDRRAKKAEYIPDVSLALNYVTTVNFGNVLPSNITSAGLYLTWEPWDWGRKRHEIAGKQAQEDQAKVAVESAGRAILLEVRNSWRQVAMTRRQLAVSESNQRVLRQKLKEIQDQFKQEAVLAKDMYSAQSDLASADSQYQQALTAFWKARADLKKAIGEE